MVFFNYTTMQMTAKIVYYGPGLCGKTTNLQAIHQRTAPQTRGEMVSLETETDRTLFFDLLPIEVGVIGGMKVRLQLYTVPGQVFYNATRKLVLKGVDGIVFVADSQAAMLDANVESLMNLHANLAELGLGVDTVPIVFQYNKRDIRNIHPVEKLNEVLNAGRAPYFEAAAVRGIGVFETLKAISKLGLSSVRKKLSGDDAPSRSFPSIAVTSPAPAPVARGGLPAALGHSTGTAAAGAPAEEPPALEFAREDTDKHVVAVTTQGHLDIQQELEKLRALAGAPAPRAAVSPAGGGREFDRRLQDILGKSGEGVRQDIKRKASVEVPARLLRGASAVTVQLVFDGDKDELTPSEAVTIPLASNRRLERLTLHLDLEIKGKA